MIRKKVGLLENSPFHSAAVKDTLCTIRLLAKFELPTRASDKTVPNYLEFDEIIMR